MILICFDGSDDARSAVEHAATLLPGQPATVLTVWESFLEVLTRSSFGVSPIASGVDMETIDGETRQRAESLAQEGAELASQAGFDARPRTCQQESSVANAILDEAEEISATAIVMGSRGLTGVKSVLLGSVSHGVIQHADRTVIVVPSPNVSAERHHLRHGDQP